MMSSERRISSRTLYQKPHLAAIHPVASTAGEPLLVLPLFVGVLNQGEGGFQIDSPQALAEEQICHFSFYNFATRQWQGHLLRVAWVRPKPVETEYLVGLQTLADYDLNPAAPFPFDSAEGRRILSDYAFLLQTPFFSHIPRHGIWSLLNCLRPLELKASERLITQGDPGDSLFLIQEGSCLVLVDNDGDSHQLARIGMGEVVGEMAVLTGEPRCATVVAETPLKCWQLASHAFEGVSGKHPELRMFLTELLSKRLDAGKQTAKRTIGKYLIKTKLGNGAWGIVYEGVHSFLNMTVAIKMLKHQLAMDREFHQRFLGEAKIIAMFNHRNIVHVYDIEALYRTLFIVMEYLEGETLEDRLARNGLLSPAQAVSYLVQICSGLAYAHGKGIIHQDIKPANIHILPDEQIKILDFGLACPVGSENFEMEGTAYYMAPEQIDSLPVDARTDIYNLGITAYEMVTGRRPYPEEDLGVLMDLHLNVDIPDPALLVPDLPEELGRFIRKSCARQPAERYQDMQEAIAELQPFYNSSLGALPPPGRERQRLASLFLLYRDEQVGPMSQLLEEFRERTNQLGVVLRAAEFKDI